MVRQRNVLLYLFKQGIRVCRDSTERFDGLPLMSSSDR